MLQSVPCSSGTRGQQQWVCLWEVCPGRGASLLTDRKEAGKQGEEYWSKKEKVKKEFNYLPWDRHKRADRMHDMEDSLSSVQRSDLNDRGQWWQVHAECSRQISATPSLQNFGFFNHRSIYTVLSLWWQTWCTCRKAGKESLHRSFQGSLKEL